jgi:hypothetical protein
MRRVYYTILTVSTVFFLPHRTSLWRCHSSFASKDEGFLAQFCNLLPSIHV